MCSINLAKPINFCEIAAFVECIVIRSTISETIAVYHPLVTQYNRALLKLKYSSLPHLSPTFIPLDTEIFPRDQWVFYVYWYLIIKRLRYLPLSEYGSIDLALVSILSITCTTLETIFLIYGTSGMPSASSCVWSHLTFLLIKFIYIGISFILVALKYVLGLAPVVTCVPASYPLSCLEVEDLKL